MMGNLGAQILLLATLPFITRLFSPEQYGTLALFVSVCNPLIGITSLRYNAVILLPKKRSEAINTLALSLLLVLVFSALIAVLMLVLWGTFWKLLGKEPNALFWYLPVNILLGGWAITLGFWFTRKERFNRMAISRFAEVATDKLFVILVGYWINGAAVFLLLGLLIGRIVSIVSLGINALRKDWEDLKAFVSFDEMKRTALRYKQFAGYSGWIFLNIFSREIPALCLGAVFGGKTVGLYSICNRLLSQPLIAAGDAISRSFFHKISEQYRSGRDISLLSKEMFKYLLLIILFPMFLLALFSQEAISALFGGEWEPAAAYVKLMWIFFAFNFVFRPLSVLLDIFEKQKARFSFNLMVIIFSAIALIPGIMLGDPLKVILGFVLINVVSRIFMVLWMLKLAGNAYMSTLTIFFKVSAVVTIISLFSIWAKAYMAQWGLNPLYFGIITLFSYLGGIVIMDDKLKTFFLGMIHNKRESKI